MEQEKLQSPSSGLIQGTMLPTLWHNLVTYGKAIDMCMELEMRFRKAGGALTYLQLVNMVKIQFTDLVNLLPQIQEFQENYTQILSNGHSKLSEDLTAFIFCSCLPNSYQDTTWQYPDNIMSITSYKNKMQ